MSHCADFVIVIPAPPLATGDARNVGSHDVSPQYATSTELATIVAITVMSRNGRLNISPNRVVRSVRSRHTAGSSTPRRITNAASAGNAPIRNKTRQPNRSRTSAEIAAANSAPIAHPDCINPMALPRCSAGHVSATSTDPHDHSPPIPKPTNTRHIASCHSAVDVAKPAVASE